jgi:hypothetical protein
MRLKIETPLKSGGLASGLRRALDHAHDVALLHDEELLAIELDLGSGPFAEEDAVPDFQIDWDQLAVLVPPAGPTAITSPSCGFSLAVSGMMIPTWFFLPRRRA